MPYVRKTINNKSLNKPIVRFNPSQKKKHKDKKHKNYKM